MDKLNVSMVCRNINHFILATGLCVMEMLISMNVFQNLLCYGGVHGKTMDR